VQSDAATEDGSFTRGLLDPSQPVPSQIIGALHKRYAVYRNNVAVGLVRALEANFPAVRKLVGESFFAGLAIEFARAHPPRSPLMFGYGESFADFLQQQEDLSKYPYLPDVARLEQLWRTSYHAADTRVLSPGDLAGLDENALSELRLATHPSFNLLSSDYAVFSIFQSSRGGSSVAPLDPATPEAMLLTRPQLDVQTRLVSAATSAFLQSLAQGEALADAAEHGFASSDSFDLAAAIALMLDAGAFQPPT
jgi:Putative DNA-binding domain